MIIRGQLHDNSCKKNGLNNSVPSALCVEHLHRETGIKPESVATR